MERFATIAVAILLFGSSSIAEGQMSMETSWENVPRCVGRIGRNATMTIKNAPLGTKFISAVLPSEAMEFGGGRVSLSANGIIPEGAIHAMAPCAPGKYRWTINAEDAPGQVLRTIHKDILFPEIAQPKASFLAAAGTLGRRLPVHHTGSELGGGGSVFSDGSS